MAFVLSGSTHFMSMPTDKRIEVRFLFETFAHHKIDERTFLDLCHQYDTHLADRAELLVICVSHPYSVVNDASMWSEFETAMIIACYTYGTKDSVRKFFPNRDEAACRKKFLRVIDGLQRNNMFSDFPLPPLLNSVATQVDIPDNRDNSCALQHEIRYVKRAMHLKIATMQRCERKKQYILRAKIAAQQRKILKLEKYNADMDEEEPDADESDLPVTDQSKRLVFESIELLQAPVNGRGYSDFMLQIARLLCLTSPKCYRIIRQVLPLPCETTLWKHFGGEMRQTKEQLTVKDWELIDQIADEEPDCLVYESEARKGSLNFLFFEHGFRKLSLREVRLRLGDEKGKNHNKIVCAKADSYTPYIGNYGDMFLPIAKIKRDDKYVDSDEYRLRWDVVLTRVTRMVEEYRDQSTEFIE